MGGCCSSYGDVASAHFNEKIARRELTSYREKGPGPTTRLIRDLLVQARGIDGLLLDVGSGIGALTFELLDRGIGRAVAVDASPANLAAATEEAVRRQKIGTIQFVHGDFLDLAPRLSAATVVTLDRVVCCYPTYEALLQESLRRADRYFAFSYPRDVWYAHAALAVENAVRRIRRDPFRAFVHPVEAMTRLIRDAGFTFVSRGQTKVWSADVYVRSLSERRVTPAEHTRQ